MRTLPLLAAVALLALAPGLAQAEPGPCPDHCTPPEPCGWPPDLRKYPVQYAEFWVDCVDGRTSLPVLP